jgi:hypothetical protein
LEAVSASIIDETRFAEIIVILDTIISANLVSSIIEAETASKKYI